MNNWDDEHLGNFFLHFVLIAKGNKETLGKNIAKGTTDPGVDCFDQ